MKKIFTLWLIIHIAIFSDAQILNDNVLSHKSNEELGMHLLQKSKNQQLAGYVFAGITVASYAALPFVFTDELSRASGGGGTIALSFIALGSTAAAIGFISAGTKNSGKAEMLLRHKSSNEPPGYELTMGMQYQKKSMHQRIAGYALLSSGITMMLIAPKLNDPEKDESSSTTSDIVTVCGIASTAASVPFLISAAKNKGRASILLKKESIPFSYYSRPIGLNSVMLAISLGK